MAEYTRAIDTALRFIKKKGRLVTITQETKGTYDPATGTTSLVSEADLDLYGVTLPATQSKIEKFEVSYADATSLVNKEIRFLMLAAKGASFVPRSTDVVQMDGDKFSIIGVTRLSINGEDIIYKMGVFR